MQFVQGRDDILLQEHTESEIRNYTGSFCGFVLLNTDTYDLPALQNRLELQWNIAFPHSKEQSQEKEHIVNDIIQDIVLDLPGAMVTVSFLNEPIPQEEIIVAAAHALWPEAELAARTHCAHLMIAVLPADMLAMDAACFYCKVMSSALDAANAVAVYTSGTILDPIQFQFVTAQMVTLQRLPLENLFYIGTYTREGKYCGYTVGMDAFGRDELELFDYDESEVKLVEILQQCIYKLLAENGTAKWYFTLELEDGIWEGRRKDGVMVDGHSIQLTKISATN